MVIAAAGVVCAFGYGALNKIVNNISVGGPSVADAELANKLARKLAYDRSMQGNVFDWFTVSSQNGAVTVAGYAHNPMARDSALAEVASTTGVNGSPARSLIRSIMSQVSAACHQRSGVEPTLRVGGW